MLENINIYNCLYFKYDETNWLNLLFHDSVTGTILFYDGIEAYYLKKIEVVPEDFTISKYSTSGNSEIVVEDIRRDNYSNSYIKLKGGDFLKIRFVEDGENINQLAYLYKINEPDYAHELDNYESSAPVKTNIVDSAVGLFD